MREAGLTTSSGLCRIGNKVASSGFRGDRGRRSVDGVSLAIGVVVCEESGGVGGGWEVMLCRRAISNIRDDLHEAAAVKSEAWA